MNTETPGGGPPEEPSSAQPPQGPEGPPLAEGQPTQGPQPGGPSPQWPPYGPPPGGPAAGPGMPGAPGPGMPGGGGWGPGMPPGPPAPGQGPSGLAIAGFVLSLSGFLCGITAIPGFIIGLLELGKIRRGESPPAGKGFALTAIIVGGVIMGLIVLYVLFLIIVAIASI